MDQTRRSAVPSSRRLEAADAAQGDLVLGHAVDGDHPLQVLSNTPAGDHVILEVAHPGSDEPLATVACDPDMPLVALPTHYGVCIACGRLSPCPDELAERRLERLYDAISHSIPAEPIHVEHQGATR